MTEQVPSKSERSKEDSQRLLREQITFLRSSAAAYDQGFEGEAKRLATVIRVLLHDIKTSKSLLRQLGLKDKMLYQDTALKIYTNNLLPTNGLAVLNGIRNEAGELTAQYVAPLSKLDTPRRHDPKPFDQWWKTTVIKDEKGKLFCRERLVLIAANKEGGAHVDPKLDPAYEALSRGNSMGWIVTSAAGEEPPLNDPALASIRQIAFEVDRTLASYRPDLVGPPST